MRTLLLIAAIALVGWAAPVWSQGDISTRYFSQAFARATETAGGAAKLGDFGYLDGITFLSGWVNSGDSIDFTFTLKKDVNYLIVGGGDNDAKDVDVEIRDRGKVVASENRVAADSMITFAPPADGVYLIRFTLAKSRNDLPCVCMMCVLKEGGYKIAQQDLNDCADRMIKVFAGTDKVIQKDKLRLDFHRTKNQWALFGAILGPGRNASATNLNCGVGPRLVLGMGDGNSEDVDVVVSDSTGKVIAQDQQVRPQAILDFTAVDQTRYSVKMLNLKGNGPAVIMTGIFDIMSK